MPVGLCPSLNDHCSNRTVVNDFITSSSEDTLARIRWFLELEWRPRTLNEAYYSDYRDRFVGHYKGWRPVRGDQERTTLTQRIADANKDANFQQSLTDALSALTRMGLHSTTPTDLAKLLPPDPYDAAIEIMASVRAYFQGKSANPDWKQG